MSSYVNLNPNGNYTFQNLSFSIPLPSMINKPLINIDRHQFVKQLENKAQQNYKSKNKTNNILSISETKKKIQKIVTELKNMNEDRTKLKENIEILSEVKWKDSIDNIERKNILIQKLMVDISSNLNVLRKLIAKRSAKRIRLKRRKTELNIQNQNRLKEQAERSRKIDEILHKASDEIQRAKLDEQEKLNADVFLKEVLRKKHDASKCILKLNALLKLHKARCNTLKGRGQYVSESETKAFNENIEKLKSLWSQKLAIYQKEENDIREKLKNDASINNACTNVMEEEITYNIKCWRRYLFGDEDAVPQANFEGDMKRFIANRVKWDRYISDAGTAIPVGWVFSSK